MTESAVSLVGETLAGRYRVTEELGAGGMGEVYLAVDANLDDREVVVKAPLAHLMRDRTIRDRFLDEVRNLARQKHPHIVKIQDFGEHEGRPFCVVEYLEGGSLADRLEQCGGQVEPEEVMEWLPAVAEALDFVHRAGLVHRDVKPANILFDDMSHAYLSDFGIATVMEATVDDTTVVDQHTRVGGFVGAPAYAPPEAVDRDLSPAYDQYSLAVVVYSALAGRLPFSGKTAEAFLVNKSREDPTRLDTVAGIPPACVEAVMRGLERDPRARFASCASFASAFSTGVESVDAELAGPKTRSWPWWGAALAGVAALAAALYWGAGTEVPGPRAADEAAAHSADGAAAITGDFRAGSTDAEIDAALALCVRYQGESMCERSWYASEKLHTFTPTPFALNRTEVTNRAFAAFVDATGHVTGAERSGSSRDGPVVTAGLSWRTPFEGARYEALLDVPVVHVSADDARAYCRWKGERLPSADEWEFAARGAERRVFPWGDDWDETRAAWWRGATPARPLPVGSRPEGATPDGHEDLAGNVWEWTEGGPERDPGLKGGSVLESNPANLRAAARSEVDTPRYSASDTGFRCVRDLTTSR